MNEHVDDVSRIAVLRANGIGDYIFTLPALDAIRHAYPSAEIVLLGRAVHGELLEGRPGPVDRVVAIPSVPGVTAPAESTEPAPELDEFLDQMRLERFDIALQLHGGGRHSNPFVSRLGARVTAGFRTPDAPELDRWVRYEYWQREALRYLEAVALVGAPPVAVVPRIAVIDRDRETAALVLRDAGNRIAVLHPGATDPRRRWPAEHFAAVGDHLVRLGYDVVVTGDRAEVALTTAIVEAMRGPARSVAGMLTLPALVGLLSASEIVVSNDSGPLHLAAATGTRTVGIYWCGNAVNGGPMTTHLHRPLLSWTLNCPECGSNCMEDGCSHRPSFVTDVTVADVLGATTEALAMHGADGREIA